MANLNNHLSVAYLQRDDQLRTPMHLHESLSQTRHHCTGSESSFTDEFGSGSASEIMPCPQLAAMRISKNKRKKKIGATCTARSALRRCRSSPCATCSVAPSRVHQARSAASSCECASPNYIATTATKI